MNLLFDDRQEDIEITNDMIDIVKRAILEVLKEEWLDENVQVSISFVGDEEIRNLNRDFRGVDKSTDVLSFPMDDEFQIEETMLGDVIINTKRVLEQAEEFGHSNTRELSYLTVHSVLHLLGYDHIEDEDKTLMRSKEKVIMDNLKIYRW